VGNAKIAVITGAASGIGKACAHRLAALQYQLVLCDIDETRLEKTAVDLGDAVMFAASFDVANREHVAAFCEHIRDIAPAVDVLINNAGIGHIGTIESTTHEDWDRVLAVNLFAAIQFCRELAPMMKARKQGHIFNIASVLSFTPLADSIAYVTSKYALLGMSLSLRNQLSPHGVLVSAICPGFIATHILPKGRSQQQDMLSQHFEKYGAAPAVVANAIVAALESGRPIVPGTKLAHLLWWWSRLLPEGVEAMVLRVDRMRKRILK